MRIEKTVYEVLDTGTYPATVKEITEAEGQFGPQLKWVFDLGEGRVLSGWTSQALSDKSKLGQWSRAILGEIPEDLDTEALVGRACRLSVVIKTKDDGSEFNRIDSVLAPRVAKPKLQPEQAEAEKAEVPF